MSQTFLEKGRRNLGYTIDQTILVVAVIAILITLIIASVGWDLITRASGAKLASYLTQVEQAGGSFYGRHGMWMDTALDVSLGAGAANPADNMRVLKENFFAAGDRFDQNFQSYLPGFASDGVNLFSGYGDGASDFMELHNQDASVVSGDQPAAQYFILEMHDIPFAEAVRADIAIDSQEDDSNGRVVYQDDSGLGNACTAAVGGASGTVNVELCYVANVIN